MTATDSAAPRELVGVARRERRRLISVNPAIGLIRPVGLLRERRG